MNLLGGLNHYKQSSGPDWTSPSESKFSRRRGENDFGAGQSARRVGSRCHPRLVDGHRKWKAMRLKERVENAEQNSRRDVWNAFRAALRSPNDREAILSIMRLTTKTGVHAITLRPLSPYQMQPRNLDRAGPPCDRIRFTTS